MNYPKTLLIAIVAAVPSLLQGQDDNAVSHTELVVSVAEQKIALVQDGEIVKKFPVSTSKFGLGDGYGSYRTPVGKLRISEKIGAGLPEGAVFKSRNPTGEILSVNAPGRDPIVTRILWLDGLDDGTANAHSRSIYIHGTPEERKIGKPASYGCIRMRSRDVIEIYNSAPVGTVVVITKGKLPKSKPAERFQPEVSPATDSLVADARSSSGNVPSTASRAGNFSSRW